VCFYSRVFVTDIVRHFHTKNGEISAGKGEFISILPRRWCDAIFEKSQCANGMVYSVLLLNAVFF